METQTDEIQNSTKGIQYPADEFEDKHVEAIGNI
jgi:hypothetical protein